MKKNLAVVLAFIMFMALIPLGADAEALLPVRGRLNARELAPGFQKPRAAAEDFFVDGSVLTESFEPGAVLDDWHMIDYDGDGENWHWSKTQPQLAYDGSGFMFSHSWNNSALNTDNWLVTPSLTIPSAGCYSSFYAKSNSASYLDHLQVLIGIEGIAYTSNGTIYPDQWHTAIASTSAPAAYRQFVVDLSDYAGQNIAIAVRHRDSNKLTLMVDCFRVGFSDQAVNETAVIVSPASLNLHVTEGRQLTATVLPENASFTDVTWSTSDPSVVAVNKNGGILAMDVGSAVVTATSHNGLTGTCVITVTSGGNGFAGNLIAYGVLDFDTGISPNSWYLINEFGRMQRHKFQGATLSKGAWHPADRVYYAYRENSDGSTDFVSVDPANNYSVTVIQTGLIDIPFWVSCGFDNGAVYGGFLKYTGKDEIASFEIAEIDLSTGLEGSVIADVYNETMGGSARMEFLPLHCTYAGNGTFIGADYSYGEIYRYVTDSQSQGCYAEPVSEHLLADQVGSITTYMQDIYYNPADGMLYWAYVGSGCKMIVMDLESGIAVPTGTTGLASASSGIECSILDSIYTVARVFTVFFRDGLTGDIIAEVEVEEGGAAVAPVPPVHEGYTFVGWDADFSAVTSDMVVNAVYQQNAPANLFGDVDCDGEVTFSDISLLSQYLAGSTGLTQEGLSNADMDGNNDVSFADVGEIYHYLISAA